MGVFPWLRGWDTFLVSGRCRTAAKGNIQIASELDLITERSTRMATIKERLAEQGLSLPKAGPALGAYVDVALTGNLAFVSGKLPIREEGGLLYTGKLGKDVTIEQGYEAARLCALHILACLEAAVGDLGKIRRIVRLGGYVAAGEGFVDAPKVINGASELFISLLGDAGKHSRAAIGVASLPLNAPVEVDAVVEVAG